MQCNKVTKARPKNRLGDERTTTDQAKTKSNGSAKTKTMGMVQESVVSISRNPNAQGSLAFGEIVRGEVKVPLCRLFVRPWDEGNVKIKSSASEGLHTWQI